MDWWSFIFLSCTETESVIQVESFQLPLVDSLSSFAKSLEKAFLGCSFKIWAQKISLQRNRQFQLCWFKNLYRYNKVSNSPKNEIVSVFKSLLCMKEIGQGHKCPNDFISKLFTKMDRRPRSGLMDCSVPFTALSTCVSWAHIMFRGSQPVNRNNVSFSFCCIEWPAKVKFQ